MITIEDVLKYIDRKVLQLEWSGTPQDMQTTMYINGMIDALNELKSEIKSAL